MARHHGARRVRVPDHVVMRELEGEAILLNLETETYFGLDDVGTRVWAELTAHESVDQALRVLESEFEVDPDELRRDVEALVTDLTENGLLEPRE